ncbi:unnamed protein product [Peronospora belbahrii]|uniref:SNF2 N-terminal domain-containing protein n=1 Tax=Peronospora belbahrii TaxID=622444 RepID=A0AAU9L210_9STRA|nr:unnamed protein product [Peronospora belbahrii]
MGLSPCHCHYTEAVASFRYRRVHTSVTSCRRISRHAFPTSRIIDAFAFGSPVSSSSCTGSSGTIDVGLCSTLAVKRAAIDTTHGIGKTLASISIAYSVANAAPLRSCFNLVCWVIGCFCEIKLMLKAKTRTRSRLAWCHRLDEYLAFREPAQSIEYANLFLVSTGWHFSVALGLATIVER